MPKKIQLKKTLHVEFFALSVKEMKKIASNPIKETGEFTVLTEEEAKKLENQRKGKPEEYILI
jgi:hypothetical protein